jgi:hypothetical protein
MRSRLSNGNKSDYNFSSLKTSQAEDIFRNLVEKIINKIGKLSEVDDDKIQDKKVEIMDMLNDILESNN